MKKRILALILVVVMAAGLLTGCGDDGKKDPAEDLQDQNNLYAYLPEYSDLEFDMPVQYVNDFFQCGELLYFVADVIIGKETVKDPATGVETLDENGKAYEYDVTQQRIFVMEPGSNTPKMLDYTVPELEEGMQGGSYLGSFYPGDNGSIWFLESVYSYYYDLPEDFDPAAGDEYDMYYVDNGTKLDVVNLAADGTEQKRITLQVPEESYIGQVIVLPNGSVYGSDWSNIYRFDQTGAVAGSISVENGINEVFALDGKLAVTLWDENKNVLKYLNEETMAFEDGMDLPENCYTIRRGFGEYLFTYEINGAVYGMKAGTNQGERIFSWMDCDVDNNNIGQSYAIADDAVIYALESAYNMEAQQYEFQFLTMKSVDPATLPQKEELVLGCLYLDYDLRSMIVDFNRKNPDLRIKVRSYIELAADGSYEDAVQKLNTEIISGVGPDLLICDELPVSQYAGRNILVDLWPLIDSDKELSRDDLMTNLFDAMSMDGKLYQVVDTFSIRTAAVSSAIAQGRNSWTLDEVLEAMEGLQPDATMFSETLTKSDMLNQMVMANLSAFMDWGTGQCSFDSEEFISLLKFVDTFPKEFDYENYDWQTAESEFSRIKNGKQLMSASYIYSFDEVQVQAAMHGGDVTFIGYPSAEGKGSGFQIYGGLAITSHCTNVEGAWSFVRQILLEENQTKQYMYEFPTNRHSFEAMAQKAMTPTYYTDPETGEQVEQSHGGIGYGEDFMVELYAVKQEEYDAFMELYNNCTQVNSNDTSVLSLIMEEAQVFFDGQKSAEETASLIQNRVSLYMAEHL